MCSVYDRYIQTKGGTHAESDSNERETALGDSAEDFGSLTADGKTKQDARSRIQVTVTGGEGTGEDTGVDDVWEDLDSSAIDGKDVWTEGMEGEAQTLNKRSQEGSTSERRCQFCATILDHYRAQACR